MAAIQGKAPRPRQTVFPSGLDRRRVHLRPAGALQTGQLCLSGFPRHRCPYRVLSGPCLASGRGHRTRASVEPMRVCFFVFLVTVILGGGIAASTYKDFVIHPAPVYAAAVMLTVTAICIFVFNRKREYFKMLLAHAGMTVALLVMLLLARPSAEPWVSCKDITDIFKTVDHSGSTVLASKFYVRGIRFYTDRKMAVIDINGEGFFSPHPVPFFKYRPKGA